MYFRSTDNGDNWTPVINGLTNTYVLGLAINSHDDIFAATYDYVFRSTDNGENWVQLTNGLTNPYCWCLAINSLDYIFLGTEGGGGVFRSTDNGDTWVQVNNGLTTPNIIDALAINSTMMCLQVLMVMVFSNQQIMAITGPN